MSLRELQQNWQQGVFDETPEPMMPTITNPEERILIYIDAYRARLEESMEKIFVLLSQAMEPDDFYELIYEYINLYPSEYYSLSKFGQNFSGFIKDPKLSELAELDWAISIAVEAKSAEPITRDYLKNFSEDQWNNIIFTLHPSVQILNKYRVYRKDTQVYYLEINSQEKVFLDLVQQNKTFGEISEKFCQILSEEEVVNFMISQLLRWIEDGLITAMTVHEEIPHELV